MLPEITPELRHEIAEKGYETASGRINFPKWLRDKYRQAIADYRTDEGIIRARMIDIYNEETRA